MPGRSLRSMLHRGTVLAIAWLSVAVRSPAAEGIPSFERDIRPILRAHCLDCHGGGDTFEGSLDLRQVRSMQRGGDG